MVMMTILGHQRSPEAQRAREIRKGSERSGGDQVSK